MAKVLKGDLLINLQNIEIERFLNDSFVKNQYQFNITKASQILKKVFLRENLRMM